MRRNQIGRKTCNSTPRIINIVVFTASITGAIFVAITASIGGDFGSAAYWTIISGGFVCAAIEVEKSEKILRETQARETITNSNRVN